MSEKLAEDVEIQQLTLSGLKDAHAFSYGSVSDIKGRKAGLAPPKRWEGQHFTPLAQVLEVAGNF